MPLPMSDKTTEIIIGISITGLVSTVVWLLKACDRLDLECHDLRRDVAHLQREKAALSAAVTENGKESDVNSDTYNRYFSAIERRFNRLEGRLNSLYSRRSTDVIEDTG